VARVQHSTPGIYSRHGVYLDTGLGTPAFILNPAFISCMRKKCNICLASMTDTMKCVCCVLMQLVTLLRKQIITLLLRSSRFFLKHFQKWLHFSSKLLKIKKNRKDERKVCFYAVFMMIYF